MLIELFKRYRGVLLDVDGTLVDSNRHHAETWQQALNEAGYPVDLDTVFRLIGKGADKLLPELSGLDQESEAGKAILAQQGELFKRRIPQMVAFDGVRELIEALRKADFVPEIASSGQPDDVEKLLRQINISDLLTPPPETDAPSKPDPDALLLAAERLGLEPRDCLMIGDTPYDLQAAQKADCDCVIFNSNPMWTAADFEGATLIVNQLGELLQTQH